MKHMLSDKRAFSNKAWLGRLAILAAALGLGTWLLLTFLVPRGLPEDFPGMPALQPQDVELHKLLGGADAAARRHANSADFIGRLGMIYHSNQYYEQAETSYRIASRLAPRDFRWTYCMALMKEENGQERELLEFLQKTVRQRPYYIPALQKLADMYFKQDKTDEAARYYDRCLSAADKSPPLQASFGLGRIAARRQDWRKVVEYVAPVSRQHPLVRPPHQLLADAYDALGESVKAAEERRSLLRPNLTVVAPVDDQLSEELLELCCSSTRLLKQAGFISRFGHSDQELRLARRAVEVEPDDADAQHYLSRTLLKTHGEDPKAVDEAFVHLNEGLRLRPDDLKPLLLVADIFFSQNKTSAAIEQLRAMLARNANSAEAHYYLGVATEHQGKIKDAVAHYQRALKLDPSYAEPCHRIGLVLARQGQLERAIGYLQKAVNLKPTFILAHYNLGLALEKSGRIDEAIAQYTEVLRLKPFDAAAHMNLGLVLAELGKFEEAAQHFRETVLIMPGDAEAHYDLGCALASQGNVDGAEAELRQALKLQPDYLEARSRLQELERKKP
jgi:tetratricopeptide (TPR) repeat protein